MGDRRNIVLEYPEADVALYTHWGGDAMPFNLQNALKHGQDRWSDPAYLGRILFSQIVGEEWTQNTGHGLEAVAKGSRNYCEASDRDLWVDLEHREVRDIGGGTWTFEDYLELTEDQLSKI